MFLCCRTPICQEKKQVRDKLESFLRMQRNPASDIGDADDVAALRLEVERLRRQASERNAADLARLRADEAERARCQRTQFDATLEQLVQHYSAETRYRLEPWLAGYERLVHVFSLTVAPPKEELRERFLQCLSARTLPLPAFLLALYTLYGGANDDLLWLRLSMSGLPQERLIRAHNAYVIHAMEVSADTMAVKTWGPYLAVLEAPLLPPNLQAPQAQAYMADLLAYCMATYDVESGAAKICGAGAGPKRPLPRLWAENGEEKEKRIRVQLRGGEPYLELVQGPDGVFRAEAAPIASEGPAFGGEGPASSLKQVRDAERRVRSKLPGGEGPAFDGKGPAFSFSSKQVRDAEHRVRAKLPSGEGPAFGGEGPAFSLKQVRDVEHRVRAKLHSGESSAKNGGIKQVTSVELHVREKLPSESPEKQSHSCAKERFPRWTTSGILFVPCRSVRVSPSFGAAAKTVTVSGGDFDDCLSSDDIDRLLSPVLPENGWLRSIELYNVRTKAAPTAGMTRKLHAMLGAHKKVLAPLHIRFHWTLAVFTRFDGRLRALVLDSAPSPITAQDIHQLCASIGVAEVCIFSPGKQPRGSNECGVHAIVNAWRAHFNAAPRITDGELSLAHLRHVFAKLASQPHSLRAAARRIALDPQRSPSIDDLVDLGGGATESTAPQGDIGEVKPYQTRPPPYDFPHSFTPPCAGSKPSNSLLRTNISAGGTRGQTRPPAGEPATAANVARYQLCYLHVATQALDLVIWGRTIARTTDSLWRLQTHIGHVHGVQQDVVETIPTLTEKCAAWKRACALWCRADGLFSQPNGDCYVVPHSAKPFIALDNQADAFRCPPSHEVMAWVEFVGARQESRSGISSAGQGHYLLHLGAPPARDRRGFVTCYVLRPRQCPDESVQQPLVQHPASTAQVTNTTTRTRADSDKRLSERADPRAQAATARALGLSVGEATQILERGARAQRARIESRQGPHGQHQPGPGEQTDATDPRPQPLSRRQLRTTLSGFAAGDPIRVHWGRQVEVQGDHEAGIWFGLVKALSPSFLVEFTHSQCADCLAPRSIGPEMLIELPLQRTLYYEVSKTPVPSVAECVCLATDPTDDRPYEHSTGLANAQLVLAAPEGSCLGAPGAINPRATLTGAAGQSWHIFAGKPPHVHELVWRKLAACTRAQHLRWLHCIRGMHADLLRRPLPAAIVEYVLRMANARRWCWATVSSALSACASALAQLPVYTSEQHSIDVRSDPYFAQALHHAQRMARTTAGKASLSTGMTLEQLESLTGSRGIKAPNPRLLLLLGWHLGARIGDLRQVRPCDIVVRHREARADGAVPVAVTFRFGKGAAFWGPYSVHAVLPRRVAAELTAAINARPADEALFSLHDQATLSHAIAAVAQGTGRLNLRSVRRGAIQDAAQRGLSDADVMRLSGHRRLDTLYRYLGWGIGSHTAKHAAIRRYQAAVPRGGGADAVAMPPGAQPPKMGLHSGFTGARGRRVEAPPEFFPKKPPTREQCGVLPGADHDTSHYQLHIKETSRVDWQAVQSMALGTPLQQAVEKARSWCTSEQWYGPPLNVEPRKIPSAGFTADQVRQLLRADKIRPHHGPVRGFVKAFTVAQHAKRRLRVIAEPAMNQTVEREHMYQLAYPSRLERRARARGAKFSVEFDFAAYFDQFQLAEDVMPRFVLRSREEVDGHRLFALTRMPMGASFAPGAAQAVTSALVYPLVDMSGVRVDTMIDNVRIVADSKAAFVRAVRTFFQRVRAARITLNDAAEWEGLSDDAMACRCAVTEAPRVFLGEKYVGDTVANSDAAVEKLTAALDRYVKRTDPEDPEARQYSHRNFASFVGLMLFMAHTVNVPLTKLHTLLRAYGAIISGTNDWDATCVISSEAVERQVLNLAAFLIRNEPVPLPVLRPPEPELDAYDVAIEVDASLAAWGAVVRFNKSGRTVTLQQRWSTPVSHSAHAEPRAGRRAVLWARAQPGFANARIAVVTDHVAMATGQRRWYASYGGFSTSFFLNSFFEELYDHGGGEVFHIDGVRNGADQLSRDPRAPLTMAVREVDLSFTDLRSLRHPHRTIPRLPYQL